MRLQGQFYTDSFGKVVQADSKEELLVAKVLHALGLMFKAQVAWWGGTGVQSGLVIDFVVYIGTTAVAVEVQAERWHKGELGKDDQLRITRIMKVYNTVIILWTQDLQTEEDCRRKLVKELGV